MRAQRHVSERRAELAVELGERPVRLARVGRDRVAERVQRDDRGDGDTVLEEARGRADAALEPPGDRARARADRALGGPLGGRCRHRLRTEARVRAARGNRLRGRGRRARPPARSARSRAAAARRGSRCRAPRARTSRRSPRRARRRCRPRAATACTRSTRLRGSSTSVSRVPGPPPRTSTPPTAPSRASDDGDARQVRRIAAGRVTDLESLDVDDRVRRAGKLPHSSPERPGARRACARRASAGRRRAGRSGRRSRCRCAAPARSS